MMAQIKKMDELKNEVQQMGNFSSGMVDSMSDLMGYLNSLEQQFNKIKHDASKLQSMNQEMGINLSKIESKYLNKLSN